MIVALLLALPWLVPPSRPASQPTAQLAGRIELELPGGERKAFEAGRDVGAGQATWKPSAQHALPEGALVARFEGFPQPLAPTADRVRLELLGGDRLFGRASGGRGDQLLIEVGGAPLALDVEQLVGLTFEDRIPEDPTLVLEAPESGDRLYRQVADRLDRMDGTLDGFSAEGVAFDSLAGRQLVPWEELAALFIEPLGPAPIRKPGPTAVTVCLVDGSRLRGELSSLSAERLELALPSGAPIGLPLGVLSQVESADGRLSYLSDLVPVEIDPARPFGDDLGMVWWPRADGCVAGGPLLVGERTFPRGYGMASPSRLAFALDGSWKHLRGAIAIDRSVADLGLEGSVRFKLLFDGQPRYESQEVRRSDGLLPLPELDLTGVLRLELVTEMASDLFEGDRADWIDLRLVR